MIRPTVDHSGYAGEALEAMERLSDHDQDAVMAAIRRARVGSYVPASEELAARQQLADGMIDHIGRICHEANRAYCKLTGDPGLPAWDDLEESYRASTRHGVRCALLPGHSPEASHAGWMMERLDQGWKYGPVLDRAAKIHPNLVPYDQLPESQQRKDALFLGIVEAIVGPLR